MSKTLLAAAMLAASLTAFGTTGVTVAGHTKHGHADRMDLFAAHHGDMLSGIDRADDAISPPRLGIAIAELSQTELDAQALEYGVRVERVTEGSIAAAAGVEAGDIVTAFGERPAYSPQRLQHLVNTAEGETSVSLTRDGQALQLPVDLTPVGRAALGIRIQNMTADLKEAFGTQGDRGVLIAQVNAESAAAQAGLKAGDVVVSVGDDAISRVDDVHAALAQHAPGDALTVRILRERAPTDVTVTLGAVMQQAAAAHGYKGKDHGRHHGHGMRGHHGEGKHGSGGYGHHGWHGGHAAPGCYSKPMQRPS